MYTFPRNIRPKPLPADFEAEISAIVKRNGKAYVKFDCRGCFIRAEAWPPGNWLCRTAIYNRNGFVGWY